MLTATKTIPAESPARTLIPELSPPRLPDKYQMAIEYLIDHPDEIENAWTAAATHVAGCLFSFCGTGCLTMTRQDRPEFRAQTEELTRATLNDSRIPAHVYDITLLDLPVFAEWQRRLDKEIRTTPPRPLIYDEVEEILVGRP